MSTKQEAEKNTYQHNNPQFLLELELVQEAINKHNETHKSTKMLEYVSNNMYVVRWEIEDKIIIISKIVNQDEIYTYIRDPTLYTTMLANIINRGESIANIPASFQ